MRNCARQTSGAGLVAVVVSDFFSNQPASLILSTNKSAGECVPPPTGRPAGAGASGGGGGGADNIGLVVVRLWRLRANGARHAPAGHKQRPDGVARW